MTKLKNTPWRWITISATLLASLISGCASDKSTQAVVEKEYKRIADLQQRKAAFEETEMERRLAPSPDAKGFELMGDGYLQQGNIDMAFIQYTKAIQSDAKRMTVRVKMGNLMLKKKLWVDALSEFDKVLTQDGSNTQALQGRATALLHLDKTKEAEQALKATLTIDPKLWQAYGLLGNVYDRTHRYEEAEKAYRMALAINAKAVPIYDNLGVSLYQAGKYRESVDELLRALKLDPSNLRIYNNLGLVLFKMGMFQEALEAFQKSSDEGTAYNSLGVLYMKDKKYADAVEAFQRAIDAKPVYYKSAHVSLQKARAALKAQQARLTASAE